MSYRIFTLVGGISKNSINRKLFEQIKDDSRFTFDLFDISALPFFSQDLEHNPPEIVKDMRARIKAADSILVITPEYNRSMPGVLKNALDWGSRPPGQNIWTDKPGAIMGASGGDIGTFGAQQHLRNVMSYLNIHVMSQPEYYLNFVTDSDGQGKLNERSRAFAKTYLDAMEAWIKKFC